VLDAGMRLPEGQRVSVLALRPADSKAHSILDIPPVSVGAVLHPFSTDDGLLGDMLEDRS
jgi:hypothetical protein